MCSLTLPGSRSLLRLQPHRVHPIDGCRGFVSFGESGRPAPESDAQMTLRRHRLVPPLRLELPSLLQTARVHDRCEWIGPSCVPHLAHMLEQLSVHLAEAPTECVEVCRVLSGEYSVSLHVSTAPT